MPGFLIWSLSDNCNAPGRLAGYKHQFQRACRRTGDDPSIFAIELETLARRAFIDIDTSIQLQMVRVRHSRLLSGVGKSPRSGKYATMSVDRCPARVVCQVTEDEPAPAALPETGNREHIIRKLLPTPVLPSPPAVPIPSDWEVLIQQLMGVLSPPTPVARVQSPATALETMLLNWLPVRAVTEEDAASPDTSVNSVEGCFSCGELTHTTDQCRTLDESFPFLPTGWQAEHIADQFILGPGPTTRPQSHQMGNTD